MREFLCSTRGNITMVMAISAVPLMLACGVAVDFAGAHFTETRLQVIADGAALAAAVGTGTDDQREEIGRKSARKQSAAYPELDALGPTFTVTVTGNTAEVRAEVTQPTLLMHLAGIGENPIDAEAEAVRRDGRPVCMLALDEDASDSIALAGSPNLIGNDCVVQSNSTADDAIRMQGAASAEADQFCGVGGFNGNGGNFDPPPTAHCPKVADPLLASLPPPSTACDGGPNSFSGHNVYNVTAPGGVRVFCGGLTIGTHATVDLAPNAVYVIKDGPLDIQAHATLRGTNVTLYFVGDNTGLDLRGGGSADIAAPTSGPYRGLAIVQDPASNPGGTSVITGGGDIRFVGILYMPTQTIQLQGNGAIGADSPAWSMVAARFTMQGTPDLTINSDFEGAGYGDPRITTPGGVVLVR